MMAVGVALMVLGAALISLGVWLWVTADQGQAQQRAALKVALWDWAEQRALAHDLGAEPKPEPKWSVILVWACESAGSVQVGQPPEYRELHLVNVQLLVTTASVQTEPMRAVVTYKSKVYGTKDFYAAPAGEQTPVLVLVDPTPSGWPVTVWVQTLDDPPTFKWDDDINSCNDEGG